MNTEINLQCEAKFKSLFLTEKEVKEKRLKEIKQELIKKTGLMLETKAKLQSLEQEQYEILNYLKSRK